MVTYVVFGVLVALVVAGTCISQKVNYGSVWEPIGVITAVVSGVVLLGLLVGLPVAQMTNRTWIVGFKAKQRTIAEARTEERLIENAALTQNIIEANAELAELQWLDTCWDLYIPDEVHELKPIK